MLVNSALVAEELLIRPHLSQKLLVKTLLRLLARYQSRSNSLG